MLATANQKKGEGISSYYESKINNLKVYNYC